MNPTPDKGKKKYLTAVSVDESVQHSEPALARENTNTSL